MGGAPKGPKRRGLGEGRFRLTYRGFPQLAAQSLRVAGEQRGLVTAGAPAQLVAVEGAGVSWRAGLGLGSPFQ